MNFSVFTCCLSYVWPLPPKNPKKQNKKHTKIQTPCKQEGRLFGHYAFLLVYAQDRHLTEWGAHRGRKTEIFILYHFVWFEFLPYICYYLKA